MIDNLPAVNHIAATRLIFAMDFPSVDGTQRHAVVLIETMPGVLEAEISTSSSPRSPCRPLGGASMNSRYMRSLIPTRISHQFTG